MNVYAVLGARPVERAANVPVVPVVWTRTTFAPPMTGSLFRDVGLYTTPRPVMVAPPSESTVPPRSACRAVMLLLVGVETVGADWVDVYTRVVRPLQPTASARAMTVGSVDRHHRSVDAPRAFHPCVRADALKSESFRRDS